MNIKKAYILYNSLAGNRHAFCSAKKIAKLLYKKCGAQSTLFSSNSKQTDEVFCSLIKNEPDSIAIILGGDGTLGAICQAFILNKITVPIAVYPSGTANDFAISCGIKRCVSSFVKLIIKNEPSLVDVAQINKTNYAINAVGSGNFSNGVTKYNAKAKKLLGVFGYYFTCLKDFFKLKSAELEFTCDNKKPIKIDTYMYYLVNATRAGGFNNFANNAKINDGKFDLIVVKKCSKIKCLKVFFKVLSGKHLNMPEVYFNTVSSLKVSGGEQNAKFCRCDIDGNAGPDGNLSIKIIPNKINIIINNSAK